MLKRLALVTSALFLAVVAPVHAEIMIADTMNHDGTLNPGMVYLDQLEDEGFDSMKEPEYLWALGLQSCFMAQNYGATFREFGLYAVGMLEQSGGLDVNGDGEVFISEVGYLIERYSTIARIASTTLCGSGR
jgi:hypothetical protein